MQWKPVWTHGCLGGEETIAEEIPREEGIIDKAINTVGLTRGRLRNGPFLTEESSSNWAPLSLQVLHYVIPE